MLSDVAFHSEESCILWTSFKGNTNWNTFYRPIVWSKQVDCTPLSNGNGEDNHNELPYMSNFYPTKTICMYMGTRHQTESSKREVTPKESTNYNTVLV